MRKIIPDAQNTALDLGIDALDVTAATDLNMDVYTHTAKKDIKKLEQHVLQYISAPFSEKFSAINHDQQYDDIQDISEKLLQYFQKLDAPASVDQ